MSKKYIHYCWFGDKQFPKLGKKCLASWKKYLPDFEIKKWTEDNVDLEECAFVKEAYENKKWAFVADYVRAKVLKEYGGIYFDTDMEILKKIDKLLEDETFLGIEESGYVAVGVWYEKQPNAVLPTKLLNFYQEQEKFEKDDLQKIAIPKIISKVLEENGFDYQNKGLQKLDHDIVIYPREYFYPYSFNRTNNLFTDNTCMIHYYDASWLPPKERIENTMIRYIGTKNTKKLLASYRLVKKSTIGTAKKILYDFVKARRKKIDRKYYASMKIDEKYEKRLNDTLMQIRKYKNKNYIIFHNKNWLGVTSATKELFDNIVDCGELYRKSDIEKIGNEIIDNNISQVFFSSLSMGQDDLIKYIKAKNKKIKIKVYWHGSHSQVLDVYGWERNVEIIKLHKKGYIDVFASCKESLNKFYLNQNYKAKFLTNKVTTNVKPLSKENRNGIKVGIYAAKCDDWRKNMFTQIASISLVENAEIDMVPLNETAIDYSNIIGAKISGLDKPLSRDKLIERMSLNDVNLYVTFSECAPMLPLESLEMGVPCITGNNHHYFKNNELEKYLVIKNEDNPEEIKEKIELCIKNKDKIIELYNKFKKENLKESQKQVKEFIEM